MPGFTTFDDFMADLESDITSVKATFEADTLQESKGGDLPAEPILQDIATPKVVKVGGQQEASEQHLEAQNRQQTETSAEPEPEPSSALLTLLASAADAPHAEFPAHSPDAKSPTKPKEEALAELSTTVPNPDPEVSAALTEPPPLEIDTKAILARFGYFDQGREEQKVFTIADLIDSHETDVAAVRSPKSSSESIKKTTGDTGGTRLPMSSQIPRSGSKSTVGARSAMGSVTSGSVFKGSSLTKAKISGGPDKAAAKKQTLQRINQLAKARVVSGVSQSREKSLSPVRNASSPVRNAGTPVRSTVTSRSPSRPASPKKTPARKPGIGIDDILGDSAASAIPSGMLTADRVPIGFIPIKESELEEMRATIEKQRLEIAELKGKLEESAKEAEKMKEEVSFLERLREQESSLLGVRGTPASGTSGGDGITSGPSSVSMAARFLKIGDEDAVSKADMEQIKKEILDQENLIRGFQSENEKLTEQNKSLKTQLKETERRSFVRIENLQREITALKSAQTQSHGPLTLDQVKLAARADDLEAKLASLERDASEKENALVGDVNKLKALLADAEHKIASFKGCEVEEVEAMKAKWEAEKNKFEERRLDREVNMRELMKDEDRFMVDGKLIEALGISADAKRGRVAAGRAGALVKSGGIVTGDARKVKELERVILDLRDKITRLAKGGRVGLNEIASGLMRPIIEESSYIRHQREKILRLEAELEKNESLWQQKMKDAQAEIHNLKREGQKRVDDLQKRYDELQSSSSELISQAVKDQAAAAAKRIADLEQQLEKLLQSYQSKLAETTEFDIQDHVRAAEDAAARTFRAREAALRTRIVELETLVDSQATTMEALRADRANAEKEAVSRMQLKDALVESYEAKISALRNEFHDKLFGSDEQKWMEEVHKLRVQVEELRGLNAELKSKLEISEKTREAVHNNTISILRQAQEESAKIALTHHERALSILREETKSNTKEAYDSELKRLQSSLASAETEVVKLRNTVSTLEKEKTTWLSSSDLQQGLKMAQQRISELESTLSVLNHENDQLTAKLRNAMSSWPPDRRRFEQLSDTLQDMEMRSQKKELELKELVALTKKKGEEEVQRVKDHYEPMLKKRDQEVLYFRDEINQLVQGLEALGRHHLLAQSRVGGGISTQWPQQQPQQQQQQQYQDHQQQAQSQAQFHNGHWNSNSNSNGMMPRMAFGQENLGAGGPSSRRALFV
ncbi:hypothetical protein HDU76_000219 [Blyttiomyces sp. JEL0837]|nr:hypothetical protein HDU76_000219 [Blyttiomyces sp. JEL0837]